MAKQPSALVLIALRRVLAGFTGSEKQQLIAVVEEQSGLIVRLSSAAKRYAGEDDNQAIASALLIGISEARALHAAGVKTTYSLSRLSVLQAAESVFLLRQAGSTFVPCNSVWITVSTDDPAVSIPVLIDRSDPLAMLEAKETAASIDPLALSRAWAEADSEAVSTQEAAKQCGISDRVMRYRKAKACRAAGNQGDLFGEAA